MYIYLFKTLHRVCEKNDKSGSFMQCIPQYCTSLASIRNPRQL